MCELNKNELAWAKNTHHIHENNTAGELSLKALEEKIRAAVDWI
jgi:hypothetical protein